jgi:hypothetical protein
VLSEEGKYKKSGEFHPFGERPAIRAGDHGKHGLIYHESHMGIVAA